MWINGEIIDAEKMNNQEIGFRQVVEIKKNLIDSNKQWQAFGRATNPVPKGDWYSVDVSTSNDGILSPKFVSSSDEVDVTVSVNLVTVNFVSIYLGYLNDGNWIYEWKSSSRADDSGTAALTLSFDATYYAAHKNASGFRILLTNLGSTTGFSGSIGINSILVSETDIENTDIYEDTLVGIIKKIASKFEKIKTETKSSSINNLILGNKDGQKSKLQISGDGTIQLIKTIPNHYIVFGNSISVGITDKPSGYFGMAASEPTKDWFHIFDKAVTEKNPSATHTILDIVPLESSTTQSDYDSYFQSISGALRSTSDLVIIQAGDNVNTADRLANFKVIFPKFLNAIRSACPNARIIVVGTWFNYSSVIPVIEPISISYGAEFIDINDLNTTENQAVVGQVITYSDGTTSITPDGWITHPGDSGHSEIAKRIIENVDF